MAKPCISPGKLLVTLDAGLQEALHAVGHKGLYAAWSGDGGDFVAAAQVQTYRCGRLHCEVCSKELPTFFHAGLWPSKLEVVDAQHQEKLKSGMELARRPFFFNGRKADLFNHLVAMLLPVGAAVGMAIQ